MPVGHVSEATDEPGGTIITLAQNRVVLCDGSAGGGDAFVAQYSKGFGVGQVPLHLCLRAREGKGHVAELQVLHRAGGFHLEVPAGVETLSRQRHVWGIHSKRARHLVVHIVA